MKNLEQIQEKRDYLDNQELQIHFKKLRAANKEADSLYNKNLSNKPIQKWELILITIMAICLILSL